MSRLLIAVTLVVTALLGCGGGGGGGSGSSSITISGTISGNGYAQNTWVDRILNFLVPHAYAVSASSPDYVAVFYNHGKSQKLFPIAANGAFSIDTKNMNGTIVAFVVNSRDQTMFCHFNLVAGAEKLDGFPASNLKKNMVLGAIDTTTDCATGLTIDNSDAFAASDVQDLKNVARNDDSLVLYINNLINDGVEAYAAIRFEMGAMSNITGGSYNTVSASNFKSTYYAGSSPLFYLGSANSSVTAVDIYPPSNVSYSNAGLMNVNPSYLSTADSSHPIAKSGLSYNSGVRVTTVETYAVETFPNGVWELKNHSNGSRLGRFYFNNANSFDSNGYFKGLIPKLKINSDQSGNFQSASVQLFTQKADGTLEQVNSAYVSKLIDDSVFSYVMSGSGASANFTMSTPNDSDTVFTFTAGSSLVTANISRVIFSYYIGQNKYQFFFE